MKSKGHSQATKRSVRGWRVEVRLKGNQVRVLNVIVGVLRIELRAVRVGSQIDRSQNQNAGVVVRLFKNGISMLIFKARA